jgi:hypothetical protein
MHTNYLDISRCPATFPNREAPQGRPLQKPHHGLRHSSGLPTPVWRNPFNQRLTFRVQLPGPLNRLHLGWFNRTGALSVTSTRCEVALLSFLNK